MPERFVCRILSLRLMRSLFMNITSSIIGSMRFALKKLSFFISLGCYLILFTQCYGFDQDVEHEQRAFKKSKTQDDSHHSYSHAMEPATLKDHLEVPSFDARFDSRSGTSYAMDLGEISQKSWGSIDIYAERFFGSTTKPKTKEKIRGALMAVPPHERRNLSRNVLRLLSMVKKEADRVLAINGVAEIEDGDRGSAMNLVALMVGSSSPNLAEALRILKSINSDLLPQDRDVLAACMRSSIGKRLTLSQRKDLFCRLIQIPASIRKNVLKVSIVFLESTPEYQWTDSIPSRIMGIVSPHAADIDEDSLCFALEFSEGLSWRKAEGLAELWSAWRSIPASERPGALHILREIMPGCEGAKELEKNLSVVAELVTDRRIFFPKFVEAFLGEDRGDPDLIAVLAEVAPDQRDVLVQKWVALRRKMPPTMQQVSYWARSFINLSPADRELTSPLLSILFSIYHTDLWLMRCFDKVPLQHRKSVLIALQPILENPGFR